MNLIDVTRKYETDDDCLEFLEQQRWPDGKVRCTTCGCDRISRITRKTPGKNKRTRIYQCLESTCKQQFSATNGTIFNDSHLSLRIWFMAIALIVDAKKGISAKQLQQHLGIGSYKTAWYLCHRIRKAMAEDHPTKMQGIVEVDETYVGGKAKRRGRERKSRAEQFDMVMGMREREGRVRFFHVPNAKKDVVRGIVDRHISPDARIMTDQAVVYEFALDRNFRKRHTTVNHNAEWVSVDGVTHTNTVESAFSLLKRGLIGSFHRVSIKHLHRYLSEFEYRFNVRDEGARMENVVGRMCQTKLMTYRQLVSKTS